MYLSSLTFLFKKKEFLYLFEASKCRKGKQDVNQKDRQRHHQDVEDREGSDCLDRGESRTII